MEQSICAAAIVVIVAATQFDATSVDLTWNICPIVVWATVEVNLVTVSGMSAPRTSVWLLLTIIAVKLASLPSDPPASISSLAPTRRRGLAQAQTATITTTVAVRPSNQFASQQSPSRPPTTNPAQRTSSPNPKTAAAARYPTLRVTHSIDTAGIPRLSLEHVVLAPRILAQTSLELWSRMRRWCGFRSPVDETTFITSNGISG